MNNAQNRTKSKRNTRSSASNRRHLAPFWTRLPSAGTLASGLLKSGRRALPATAVALCIGGVITGGYYSYQWATHAPRFAISSLEFSGNEQSSEAVLTELMQLEAGTNIFLVDIEALEERLESSPWISHAEVSRDLPNSLEIEVSEERVVALVDLEGLYLANEAGELFKKASSTDKLEGLTIITGLSRSEFVGAQSESQAQIEFALQAVNTFASSAERPAIGEIHLDANRGITLITYEAAIAIHLGNPLLAELEDRYQAFDSAWNALGAEEHAAVRVFRIADRTPSDRVTVAFAGN